MIKKITGWIHEEGDPLPLRAMQIYFAVQVIWQLGWIAAGYSQWLHTPGWILTDCVKPLGYIHSDFIAWLVIAATIAGAGGMIGNFYPRVSTFIAWGGFILVGKTLAPATGGGDLMVTYATFILMFARTDRTSAPLWPQKLLLLSVATFYTSAFLNKLDDQCWLDGSAVYMALQYNWLIFWPVPILLRLPQLAAFLAYSTLIIEGSLGLLPLLLRWRWPIIIAGVFLHLGISYCLFIPHFGPSIVGFYFSALTAADLRKVKELALARRR